MAAVSAAAAHAGGCVGDVGEGDDLKERTQKKKMGGGRVLYKYTH